MGEKDNERAHRSGNSRPGAHAASLGASLGSADDRRRRAEDRKISRSVKSEDKDAERGTRSSGESQKDKEREAKRNAKLSGNGSMVSSASSASDRARRKEERHGSRSDGPPESRTKQGATLPEVPTQGGFAVEATAVNEDEANERVRRLEEQMAAMMQGGNNAVVNAPVVAASRPTNDDESDEESTVGETTFFRKYRCAILIAVLVAIGGGVAGYLLGKGSDEVVTVTKSYPKPDAATCKKVAEEVVITKDIVYVDLTFEINLVEPLTEVKFQSALDSLTAAMDKRFVPLLVGCPISSARRRLVSGDLRYMVADAKVEPATRDVEAYGVFQAQVAMTLYLNGPEDAFTATDLVQDVFNNENGEETLALPSDTVSKIILRSVKTSNISPSSPTSAPIMVDATARRELLQELLADFGVINDAALDWISEFDTWQPADDSNASQQWIERYALLAFYFSTNGGGWTDKTGWRDSSRSVCGWNGIDCNGGLVRNVWLRNTGLSGTLPPEVGLLTAMEKLVLSDNRGIGGSIPTTIGKLTALDQIEFFSMSLSGSIPTEIGLLTKLSACWLYDNNLTGSIPTEIGRLTNLLNLELETNTRLSGTIPTEIGLLTAMTDFGVYDTTIGGSIPSEIGLATSLVYLILFNTPLEGSLPTEIGNLVRLEELRPYNTRIGGPIPREIGRLSRLAAFDMDDCSLTGEIPSEIINLSNLDELYLDGNQLIGVVPPLPFPLSECELQGNCFSDISNVPRGCSIDPNCPP